MSNQNTHKPGYKHTPLGWIPEEWEIVRLKHIIKYARLGGNYENSTAHTGIPVIKMGNLGRGKITVEELQYLPYDCSYYELDVLREGDLLFNTRNTLDLVGKVAVWRNELSLAVYNSNILRIEFKDEKVDSNYYMNWVFNSHYGLKQLRGFATGTTSVAAIYSRDLEQFKCLIPAKEEQRKIAAILSIWDEAITKTQQLIAQLQQRNKGLMQELLTEKKRIKGFNGDWKTVSLSECLIHTPREVPKPKTTFFALGIRSHGKGMFHKNDFDPEDLAMDALYEVKENDLVVNITFAWEQAIAIAGKYDDGGLVSHRFPTYTFKSQTADVDFFRYFILQRRFKYLLDLISPGGAGRNRVMSKKDFLKLDLKIPDVQEQKAIGSVLNAATAELKIYEQKLAALQQQKRGLMQKLLTGDLRVI